MFYETIINERKKTYLILRKEVGNIILQSTMSISFLIYKNSLKSMLIRDIFVYKTMLFLTNL